METLKLVVEKKESNEVQDETLIKIKNHLKSAEHHKKAAHYHREAAKYLESGKYQEAVNSSARALEQDALAEGNRLEEVKHHDMVD